MDDKLYYVAAMKDNSGAYLCRYDPKTGTTTPLTSHKPFTIGVYKGKLYFRSSDANIQDELFVYDPVTDTTTLLSDLLPGIHGSSPLRYKVLDDRLFFMGNTGGGVGNYSRDLFMYNGEGAPVRCTHFSDSTANIIAFEGSTDFQVYPYKDEVLIYASKGYNAGGIYAYNLKTAATRCVFLQDSIPRYSLGGFGVYRDKAIVSYFDYNERVYEFGLQDNRLKELILPEGSKSMNVHQLYEFNGVLYLSGETDNHGWELYRYYIPLPAVSKPYGLYPNPATTYTQLQFETDEAQKLTGQLVDMAGRLVYTHAAVYEPGKHTQTIPLHNLTPGVYVYTLRGNRGVLYSGKVVKL